MVWQSEGQQLEFTQWLKIRNPNDYWRRPAVPPDYAQRKYQHFHRQWQAGKLKCEHIVWHVTNRCNLKCAHCGVWGGEKRYRDLSLDEFALHIPKYLKLGVKYVTLSGGEPLVRKDLHKIIAVLKIVGFKVAMVTNGHHLERYAEALTAYPLDSISISIDGYGKAHDDLRLFPGSYEHTLDALRFAQKIEIPIRNVNTCVTPDNLEDLHKLKEDIFAAGANHWVLRPVALAGRADESMTLDSDAMRQLLDFARKTVESGQRLSVGGIGYLGDWDAIFSPQPYFNSTGWNNLYILPNGDIKGFNSDHLPVEGNLLKDDLIELWQEGFSYYRNIQLPEFCQECPYLGRCHGGNHAEADAGYRCVRPVLDGLENPGIA